MALGWETAVIWHDVEHDKSQLAPRSLHSTHLAQQNFQVTLGEAAEHILVLVARFYGWQNVHRQTTEIRSRPSQQIVRLSFECSCEREECNKIAKKTSKQPRSMQTRHRRRPGVLLQRPPMTTRSKFALHFYLEFQSHKWKTFQLSSDLFFKSNSAQLHQIPRQPTRKWFLVTRVQNSAKLPARNWNAFVGF